MDELTADELAGIETAANDPVIRFIFADPTLDTVSKVGNAGPYSRLSHSRIGLVGHALVGQRWKELGLPGWEDRVYVREFMGALKDAVPKPPDELDAALERERQLRGALQSVADMTRDTATYDVHETAVRALHQEP